MAEPVLQLPNAKTARQVKSLEKLVGTLPLSIKHWYLEVGAVNLIGAFQTLHRWDASFKRGYGLDPLFTQPLADVIEEMKDFADVFFFKQKTAYEIDM